MKRKFELATIVVLLGICSSPAQDDFPFDSGSTGADGDLIIPPASAVVPRYHTAGFYLPGDTPGVVIVGGISSAGTWSDSWLWDGTTWDRLNSLPSPRQGSAAIYDEAGGVAFLWGGRDRSNRDMSDGYRWTGTNWASQFTHNAPSARGFHTLVYDPTPGREETLLFGGLAFFGAAGDTHTLKGNTWTSRTPATSPPARYYSAGAYHGADTKIVIFGGTNGSGKFGDTWLWDGTDWSNPGPETSPAPRTGHAMAYDAARGETVLFGGEDSIGTLLNDTWVWNGTTWTERSPATAPEARHYHQTVYDPVRERIVLFGGLLEGREFNDTWEWDGTDWTLVASESTVSIDLTSKPDGVFQYGRIEVGSGVTVRFDKNPANTPVTWLASGDVVINGTVDLDGAAGGDGNTTSDEPRENAPGGPGGFAGGLGGLPFTETGSYAGSPGLGPSGGVPGTTSGQDGRRASHRDSYGNAYAIPLIGGSGGGGGASDNENEGGKAGGGGGAILIASSQRIQLNGSINARGGNGEPSRVSTGGGGSGGAVRLVADVVSGGGTIRANGGSNGTNPPSGSIGGRVRIEGFLRPLLSDGNVPGGSSYSVPLDFPLTGQMNPTLTITEIAGQPVAQPPTGSLSSPDVVFSEAGEIQVRVEGANVPDGTPVTARIITGSGIIDLPADGAPDVLMTGRVATFSATVEPGVGTIQAFVNFTQPVQTP